MILFEQFEYLRHTNLLYSEHLRNLYLNYVQEIN